MTGPGGHYLDNVIETYYSFEGKFDIYTLVNRNFDDKGTFLPPNLKILKILFRNNFEKKDGKILHYFFEIVSFITRLILSFVLIPYFLINKNLINYLIAIKISNFVLPLYFLEIFLFLKKNKLTKKDHIFFPTTRNKHIKLATFLANLHFDIPNIHLRFLYTPSRKKIGGFYYLLKKMKPLLIKKKICLYTLTQKNYDLFISEISFKSSIYKTNIPWSFYERKNKIGPLTIGYMGDARINRGFNLLPDLINNLLKKTHDLNFLIHFSQISSPEINSICDKLFSIEKNNPRVKIVKKYLDYKEFRDTLKKIDIMPILHNSDEIKLGNPSTIHSSITHEIPMILPSNLKYMREVLINKSYEEANNLDETIKMILKIKENYSSYLEAAKKNSTILLRQFKKDPLKENIV